MKVLHRIKLPIAIFKELAVRLALFALLTAVFLLCAFYIPRNVTYEYNEYNQYNDEYSEHSSEYRAPAAVRQQAEGSEEASAPVDGSIRILKLTGGSIGVYLSDGTLERKILLPEDCLTAGDLALLEKGVSVTKGELSELLESAE